MGWHERGDLLEAEAKRWYLNRFPGSTIIETKINSIHGIDFAMESEQGDVFIVEVKSPTGSPSSNQFTLEWIRERIGPELRQAICRAVVRRRNIVRALLRVGEKGAEGFQIKFGSPTDALAWDDLFPGEPRPTLDIVQTQAFESRGFLVVRHDMRGFGLSQTHDYSLRDDILSAGLKAVVLEQATFPFLVPHSHTVIEDGKTIYKRDLDDWEEHRAFKDAPTSSAQSGCCSRCGILFFGFAGEEMCCACFNEATGKAADEKRELVELAERLQGSTDWRAANQQQAELMERWKQAGSAGRDADEQLWQRFQGARQRYFERRTEHYDKLARVREQNAEEKRRLVAKAEDLARSTEWKAANQAQAELMEQWKAVGPAGRELDASLWQQFHAARQAYFDVRAKHHEQQEKSRQLNAEAKRRLIRIAKDLAESTDWKAAGEEQAHLLQQWKAIGPAGRDTDEQLWEDFQVARQCFFDRRTRFLEQKERERESNRTEKNRLVRRAESLASSDDWKQTGEEMRELMAEWKVIGPAGREADEQLWDAFQAARQSFFDRRTRFFEEKERERDSNRAEKAQLVRRAESLASSDDWKQTGEEMRELMAEWKAIGPAGRDVDERLWGAFQAARQRFFDRRTRFFEQKDGERENNRAEKARLVHRAESLASSDDWKQTGEEMRELMAEWKAIGSAGRDHDQDLWAHFNEARQSFYDRRTQYFEERNSSRRR